MKVTAAAIFACMLFTPASGLGSSMAVTMKSSLSFDAEAAKDRPVAKVVRLLKDMLIQMEKDAVSDKENYDKFNCWCITNDKIKTAAVADGESKAADLKASIESLTAKSSSLTTEIKDLKVELAADTDSFAKATALNGKLVIEFVAEEKKMLQTILQLGNAIKSMSKKLALAQSFAQMPASQLDVVVSAAQEAMLLDASFLDGVLTHTERQVVSAFIQAPGGEYAPAGGQITGILKQMKETFETNLGTTQTEEKDRQKGFFGLKKAKETEIASGNDQISKKSRRLADTNESNAQAKQNLKDTKKILAADVDFLNNLKERCALNDKEWEARQKSRITEVAAVNKALTVLTSDEARDMFSKSLGVDTSFVQTESAMNSKRRAQVTNILKAAAEKLQKPHLAALAYRMRLDAFTKVLAAIQAMITELTTQNADEVKENEFCIDELNRVTQERLPEDKRQITDDKTKIAGLLQLKKNLIAAIKKAKADIATNNLEMKVAGEEREKQNQAYQQQVADQQATQKLLKTAMGALGGSYEKVKARAGKFIQEGESQEDSEDKPAGAPPPKGFDSYEKNGAAGGVMEILQQIISDSKQVEDEAVKEEQDANAAYVSLIKAENAATAALQKDLDGKEARRAKTMTSLIQENKELKSDLKMQKKDQDKTKALHKACDYVMKNFDVRQAARTEEKDALKQAMAILKTPPKTSAAFLA